MQMMAEERNRYSEKISRMASSTTTFLSSDSLPDDSNGDSEGDNVPPPCPEAPSPSPFPRTPTTSPFPRTPPSSPPLVSTPGSEPIRSILKKRHEASARGLPGLQGLLGLQSLQGLKGIQGLQELHDLEGPYSKSAYHGEDSSRVRPSFSPSQPDYPDHES